MKLIILILLTFSIGCNQQRNKSIIASNKGKYWDVVKNRNRTFDKPSYCYYFGSSGDCFYYNYRIEYGKIKRELFKYGDVIYPNTWELKSDTLQIQGFDYLIKNINEKNITLQLAGDSSDTLILNISPYPN